VGVRDRGLAGQDSAHTLVGRSSELERIAHCVDEAARHGAALMIFGDPGVGKSALLNVAAGICSARGGRVLTAAGLEHEAEISLSTLSLLLQPVQARLAELPPARRVCLSVALGLAGGPAPSRLMIANSVLELLGLAANRNPVLVIVDDLQWVDRSTAAVLGLVSRRLAGTRIGFLAAARTDETGFFESSGVPEMHLEALDSEASSRLVDAEFPDLAARVRHRVLTESEGNPLALLELPAALSLTERSAEQVLPDVLPLGRRLQRTFADRLVHLPDSVRAVLLLAALEDTGDLRALHHASEQSGIDVLAPAERAHLVRVDDGAGRVVFRHPLVRAAVVAASTSAERRHAHRVLAQHVTDQQDRRAWHLAAACMEPDEAVSALLKDTAERVLRRGDAVGAVAALIRAADLHPDGAQRSRLLAKAAFVGAGVTGDLRNVPRLLANARRSDPGHGDSLPAAVAASYALLSGDGDILTAHRLLVSAIEAYTLSLTAGRPGADAGALDPPFVDALHSLLSVCSWAERAELWPPLLSAIAQLGPRLPRLLHLRVQVQGDPARLDAATLAEFDRAVLALREPTDPTQTAQLAIAAMYVDRIDGCREALWRVIEDGRAGGAINSAIRSMMAMGVGDFAVGRWDEALDLAIEGLELCETHGYGLQTWFLRAGQALIAAGRGDEELVRSLTEQMMRWAAPRRQGLVQMFAHHARGLSALGQGAFEAAYQHLSAICSPGEFPAYTAYALKISLDLVEAAVRTGRHDEAAAHVDAMRSADLASLSGHLALMTAAAAALCASGDEAVAFYEQALTLPDVDRWPFDLARVHLAYGEHLRRHHAPRAAKPHLDIAVAVFERLGARPWMARADNELRTSGRTRRHHDDVLAGALTPQEREIGLMAASGMSNKQIGEHLFLSPRTVATHLYRAFPKLGITSRAALRDALTEAAQGDTSSGD
jgi:DNA-binding CsgD family transcriptional regulator/energy-coupling factor transporter ATP-binding protein EcfA2/tetratricopeptide (TPR) repeat protein